VTEATAPVIPHQRYLRETMPVALRPRLEATWAVCCGALAAGALALDVTVIVRLLAGWLLADIILGFALAQLLATIRVAVEVGPPPDTALRQGPRIPYAQPGSPGDRLARALARWLDHWHERLQPAIGHHVASCVTASAIALLVGAYLGEAALAISAGTVAFAVVLALMCGPRVDTLARWYAGIALGTAWYLGHRLFAVVPPASWGVAALVGLAAFGRVAHDTERASGAHCTQRGRRLVGFVWSALTLAMLAARQPIAAGITAVAGLAEAMCLREETTRPARVGWLAAMLLAALIVARGV
jgi:hypothetical protein